MQKIRVGVIFGGKSVEHEISIVSALQAMAALDQEKYSVTPIYITKEGVWYTGERLTDIEAYRKLPELLATCQKIVPAVNSDERQYYIPKQGMFAKWLQEQIDVMLPVFHGSHGEDGCVQGLFELMNIPYAGPGVLGAAVGMDKIMMKAVLKDAGLPIVPYVWFTGYRWVEYQDAVIDEIEKELGYPVIVKPANLGSSIGIGKADTREQLIEAIDLAAGFSSRIVIEKMVESLREINCSVLGDVEYAEASVCEEPVAAKDILTYADKYMKDSATKAGDSKGMASLSRQIPANIGEELTQQVQDYAKKAFIALDGSGVSRIDFLLNGSTGQVYVNEINTIPGSLSFYLWQATGRDFSRLMDKLIELALKRNREKNRLTYSYDGNILAGGNFGGLKGTKK
ncbi:MAG: D-alanine--D-alanine ligase [Peptococcaceae bacterium]|nr:D-alanine--D-alanine ligase [Peptococcaceae bacterium]